MFHNALPLGAASAVIFLTTQAVFGNPTANADVASLLPVNTYTTSIENKLSSMDECTSESINVFFSDPFVTYHSAELLNAAFQRVSKCELKNIEVVIYDAGNALPAPELMKVEIDAFVDAHELIERPDYKIHKVEKSTPILNGLGAVIHFELDA